MQQWINANFERGMHWFRWSSLPKIERFIFQNPVWGRFMRKDLGWQGLGNRALAKRQAGGERQVDLMQRFLDASEKHPDILPHSTVTSLSVLDYVSGLRYNGGGVDVHDHAPHSQS